MIHTISGILRTVHGMNYPMNQFFFFNNVPSGKRLHNELENHHVG